MAITLSTVNEQLQKQNEVEKEQTTVLEDVRSGISSVSTNLATFLTRFDTQRLQDIEDQRESKSAARAQARTTGDKKSANDGFLGSLQGGGLFGLGAALASALPKFLLGRALPATLAMMFSNEIADYIESETGSKTLGDAIYRGLNLGALGLLLGKKFAAIGFVAGALLDQSNRNKLDDLGTELGSFGDNIAKMFGMPAMPNFTEALSFVTTNVGKAIEFITAGTSYLNSVLEDGDVEHPLYGRENENQMTKNAETMRENLGSFAASIGLLAAFIAPRGTLALALATVGGGLALVKNSIRDLGSLVGMGATAFLSKDKLAKQLSAANVEDINKLTGNQKIELGKQGINVRDGQLYNARTNMPLDPTKARSALGSVGVTNPLNTAVSGSKFGQRWNILKGISKRIPFLGTLISSGMLASILLSDMAPDEKISQISGLFGGIAGALALGAIGGLVGGPLGAIAGAGVGGIAGDVAGEFFANWLLGRTPPRKFGGGSAESLSEFGDIGTELEAGTYGVPQKTDIFDYRAQMSGAPQAIYPVVPRASADIINDLFKDLYLRTNSNQPILLQDSRSSVQNIGGSTSTSMIVPTPTFDMRDPLLKGLSEN